MAGDEGGLPRNALFHNVAGTVRRREYREFPAPTSPCAGDGCVAADFVLDGRTDLYVTSADGAGALLWNEGDGTFTEGANAAGVEGFGWHEAAAVGDVNGDGLPDLFVSGYVDLNNPIEGATLGFPNTYLGVRDLLFLNRGCEDDRVTFREVGAKRGSRWSDSGTGWAACSPTSIGDGDLDLYVANDTKPNRLYENVPWPGGARADPAGSDSGSRNSPPRPASPTPSRDGHRRLATSTGTGWRTCSSRTRGSGPRRLRGRPRSVAPSLADIRDELGPSLDRSTGWGVSWGDLDLDTDLDLVLINGDMPVTGLGEDAEPSRGRQPRGPGTGGRSGSASASMRRLDPILARGSAGADYDNDGDLDVAVNSVGGRLVLLESSGEASNWLEVGFTDSLPEPRSRPSCPTARSRREPLSGSSYLSSEDPWHFGSATPAR